MCSRKITSNGHNELKWDVSTWYQEKVFHYEDSQVWKQVAQSSFEVFIHQGSQDPEQPGLFLWLTLLGAGGWAGDLL